MFVASGDSIDATQEMLTLGLCNLFGSLVSSFPVNGSFSRSAVNHASGVKTPLGALFTGSNALQFNFPSFSKLLLLIYKGNELLHISLS